MKISVISVGNKSKKHRYYYGLLLTFIMEWNAIFQWEANENKDVAFPQSSSQTLCHCFHRPRLGTPDRESSLNRVRRWELRVSWVTMGNTQTQIGDDTERLVKPSEDEDAKVHHPQLLNQRMCFKFQNSVFFWKNRGMQTSRNIFPLVSSQSFFVKVWQMTTYW